MKNKKGKDAFCHCISYGKIEPEKIERLHKNRQKQLCAWREIVPFGERHEEVLKASSQLSGNANKPLFPPIHELSFITNYDTYQATYYYNRGKCEIHSSNNVRDDENKDIPQPQYHGCGTLTIKQNNNHGEQNGFTSDSCIGSRANGVQPQSLKLKLPKLTNSNVVSHS